MSLSRPTTGAPGRWVVDDSGGPVDPITALRATFDPRCVGTGAAAWAEVTIARFRAIAGIRDELEEAVAVLDAFHIVKVGLQAMEETQRRSKCNSWACLSNRA